LIAIVLLLAFVIPAAGQDGSNPGCAVCIDFSEATEVVSRIDPEPYTAFSAYFTIYNVNEFAAISFMASVTPGMSSPPAFTNLLPGDLAIGSWDTGITIASTECQYDPFLHFGKLDLFYLGTPGDIMILDHPDWPRWVVDCSDECPEDPDCLNFYCVWMHGGVGKDPVEGDAGCAAPWVVPVEDVSWGGIKALFR
jgi:hypothetical protein